jgi:hypothetical protein
MKYNINVMKSVWRRLPKPSRATLAAICSQNSQQKPLTRPWILLCCSTRNDSSFLKTLAEHIASQLEERPFCVVFEDDLKRCWPSNPMPQAERNSEIHRFAESQGWSATILDGAFGTRQYFKNWNRMLLITKALPALSERRAQSGSNSRLCSLCN